ncbi:unnamed protein product [Somion occarium]|uniref:Zn(2)-C6 fungal-type domain-containing protein n=1 Tax=Somion occarium TaxID=3059160 RepID=A0ABP1DQZ5_9APHY
MSQHPWPSIPSSASSSSSSAFQQQQYATDRLHGYPLPGSLNGHSQSHPQAMTLNEEYDDGEDDGLAELPSAGLGMGMGGYNSAGYGGSDVQESSKVGEKTIRRRSSKACDQCRKSKCKCERSSPNDPCRNCVMLGTPCTFLGPSRKRGPPKGYIDAIEARLHQTEALIGILLSSKDSRAKTLLEDLSEDSLAREIINRVNNTPYGHKGRNKSSEAAASSRSRPSTNDAKEGENSNLQATHPSNEWQESVIARLDTAAAQRNTLIPDEDDVFGEFEVPPTTGDRSAPMDEDASTSDAPATATAAAAAANTSPSVMATVKPALSVLPPTTSPVPGPASSTLLTPLSATAERSDRIGGEQSSTRRQRRRVEVDTMDETTTRSPSATSLSARSRSPVRYALPPPHPALLKSKESATSLRTARTSLSPDLQDAEGDEESFAGVDEEEHEGEDDIALAVGQLSINEDEQVRYHGKASGLHLLGINERSDGRNKGHIWRFPKARVWPPLPSTARSPTKTEEDWISRLPDLPEQEHLLKLYFIYVHPALPIIHKKSFMENYRNVNLREGNSPSVMADSPTVATNSKADSEKHHKRIPTMLLLAMFSIAARYSSTTSADIPPPEEGSMWAAGDSYLEDAKANLDSSYAASRPSTCQALLLMGYREVGIGAMAQAWLYIGMAVRMAQDLGMHKNADKWVNIGKNLFTPEELQERRRIWYGCVMMDKYVSTYIGRPVAIFENDFDTELPSVDEDDELEIWAPDPSPPLVDDDLEPPPHQAPPVTGHVVSCFNEAAKLSILLSMIVQAIYPIRPHIFRLTEYSRLEKYLDKWFLELPEHLRYDPASQKPTTLPPHALTLHMQYWCTVILLHRPFTDPSQTKSLTSPRHLEAVKMHTHKNYDLCVQAANHITSIVSVYVERHCVRRAPVFLCFYVFTAAIMHIATLKTYPNDPQAGIGLHKCMDVLHRMQNVWPSAWRAYQLLSGAKVPLVARDSMSPSSSERQKRPAEHALELDYPEEQRVTDQSPQPSVVDDRRVSIDSLRPQSSGSEHLYRARPSQQQQTQPQIQPSPQPQTQHQPQPRLPQPQAPHPQTHHQHQSQHGQGYPSRASSSHAQSNFALGLDLPTAASPTFFQPFNDRWASESPLSNYPSTLTTSVLPQQYSTGLIDERVQRGHERQPQRFPQYWSDYSSLGQMEAPYGVPMVGPDMVPPAHQATRSSQHTQQPPYPQDQYSVFNNLSQGGQ